MRFVWGIVEFPGCFEENWKISSPWVTWVYSVDPSSVCHREYPHWLTVTQSAEYQWHLYLRGSRSISITVTNTSITVTNGSQKKSPTGEKNLQFGPWRNGQIVKPREVETVTGTPQSARQKNAHHPHPQHRCQEPQMAPWTPFFKIKVSKQEQIRAKYRFSSSIAKQIIDQAKAKFCRKISIILGQIWADTTARRHGILSRCTHWQIGIVSSSNIKCVGAVALLWRADTTSQFNVLRYRIVVTYFSVWQMRQ